MFHHRTHVGRRHINGNGLYPCRRMTKSFPEGFEGVGRFPVTDEYDGAVFEVEDYGRIVVSLLYCDLIDGQVPEVFEHLPGELLLRYRFWISFAASQETWR
jgi:hypothetical protein